MDNDVLTNEQTEKVLQFQDLTGSEINVCRDILIRHNWDLEVAVQSELNIREGRPSMYATESRPPQVVNDRYLQHVFPNTRDSPSHAGITGFLGYVINYVFNFCYNTLSSIFTAVISIFRNQERIVTDPLGDVTTFIRCYNEKYPEHPVFYQGTYAQALNDAKRELKFLLVYLHSENNSDVVNLCRNTLSNPMIIEYINRNMFFWGCDITSPEGFRVSHSVSARSYPLMVIVGLRANKMIIMGRMEGDSTPDELLRRLQTVVGDNEVWLNQARSERLERSMTQSLRQQQDEAYEMSLRADQEKERRKQLERDEENRKQQAIEAEIEAEHQKKLDIARLKMELTLLIPLEPSINSPDSISVVFKLPNGLRLERRFLSSHLIKDVYYYIFCHPDAPDTFEITTNFPKSVLYCNVVGRETNESMTLSQKVNITKIANCFGNQLDVHPVELLTVVYDRDENGYCDTIHGTYIIRSIGTVEHELLITIYQCTTNTLYGECRDNKITFTEQLHCERFHSDDSGPWYMFSSAMDDRTDCGEKMGEFSLTSAKLTQEYLKKYIIIDPERTHYRLEMLFHKKNFNMDEQNIRACVAIDFNIIL